jgi:polyhydroxyalkanoate synthesis repressor PhaR
MIQSTMGEANAENEARELEISKYPNRRYYDKTRSRHLTLEEIYAAIRDGYEVKVTDSKTGEDITAKVLAQIILELDQSKLDVFPVPLLHRLLRANEQLITDFTQKYFSQALMTFLDSQKKAEQAIRQAMGLPTGGTTMADWARVMWGPFNPALWSGTANGETAHGAGPAASPTEAGQGELLGRLEQLQQQIAQLQERLAAAEGEASAGKKTRRR